MPAGDKFTSNFTFTLDMGSQTMGPVTSLSGDVDVKLSVGDGAPVTVNVPVNDAPPSALKFTGAGSASLTAPATGGPAAIKVGDLLGHFSAKPFNMDVDIPCVPDSGQDQTIAQTTVEGGGEPTPAGVLYDCAYQSWNFQARVDTVADLPKSVKQGSKLSPAVTSTVTWDDFWSDSSRSINAEYKDTTAAFDTWTNETAGEGSLTFNSTPVPASGPMVWTAAGSFGSVDTSTPGTAELTVGDLTIETKNKNKFSGGTYMPATMACTVAGGEDASLGSVEVEESAPVAVPVSGKVAIKGTPKVGKKLTAVPGKASGAKISYQWLSNGKVVKNATSAKMKLTKSLKGKKVSVKATYTKSGYTKVTQTSKSVKIKK